MCNAGPYHPEIDSFQYFKSIRARQCLGRPRLRWRQARTMDSHRPATIVLKLAFSTSQAVERTIKALSSKGCAIIHYTITGARHLLLKVSAAGCSRLSDPCKVIDIAGPNILRAINPRHNPTQETLNQLLKPCKLKLSLAPIEETKRRRTAWEIFDRRSHPALRSRLRATPFARKR